MSPCVSVCVRVCVCVCAVRRREDVVEACLKPATPTAAAAAAATSSSSVSRSKVVAAPMPLTSAWSVLPHSTTADTAAASLFDMAAVSAGSFYCDYCNVFCNSETQLDAHCASAKHKLNISSDRERQWNFRPPPLTVANGQYTLCVRSALLRHVFTYSHLIVHFYFY